MTCRHKNWVMNIYFHPKNPNLTLNLKISKSLDVDLSQDLFSWWNISPSPCWNSTKSIKKVYRDVTVSTKLTALFQSHAQWWHFQELKWTFWRFPVDPRQLYSVVHLRVGRRTATGCLFAKPLKERTGHFTDMSEWQGERKEKGKKAFKKKKKKIQGTTLIFLLFSVNSLIHWHKNRHLRMSDECTAATLLTSWVPRSCIYYLLHELHFFITLLLIWSNMIK